MSFHGTSMTVGETVGFEPAPSAAPQPRLVRAAHEFEAAMMKEVVGPFNPGRDSMTGDETVDGSSTALTSFATEALAKALSDRGGFGVATKIIKQLSGNGNRLEKTPVPTFQNRDTVKPVIK